MTSRSSVHVACGFCGKDLRAVALLVRGPTVFICDECVALCAEVIAVHKRSKAVPRPPPPASPEGGSPR